MLSAEPVCSCAFLRTILHTRPRVQRAPGIPCSLFSRGEQIVPVKLGHAMLREGATMFGNGNSGAAHSQSSPAHAGDPVRRGFSARTLPSLESSIARSSRATKGGD